MSKEAALRAMREARYAEMSTRAGTAPKASRPAVRPAQAPTRAATSVAAAPAAAPATDALCGHKSMNGRACTREQGHAAKSHRYS